MDCEKGTGNSFDALTARICERISRNRRIRCKLPGEGRLHIDRQLPFLCVYRRPPGDAEDGASARLVTTQAAYLIAPGDSQFAPGVSTLCGEIVRTMVEHTEAFLLIELWPAPIDERNPPSPDDWHQPAFRVVTTPVDSLPSVVESLRESLAEVQLSSLPAEVAVSSAATIRPPGMPPLLPPRVGELGGCFVIGIEVTPIYRDPLTGTTYPLVLKMLREQLSRALKRTFCAFAGMKLDNPPAHFDALGPRAVVQAVGNADRRLGEVAAEFDFVLLATPVNANEQWHEFKRKRFDCEPHLLYRPLPFHPNLLKRELFKIRLEFIEDPTLAHLLIERHQELDRQITMLADRGTANFHYGSLQLYGPVEDELLELAYQLLEHLPHADPSAESEDLIDASRLARLAEAEFGRYRAASGFNAKLEFRDDIASGVMVSRDRLLISTSMQVPRGRVRALLDHEIGTHLVTYFNGLNQPLRQLSTGLAGYETLQEGIAVLSEYLAGGLRPERMRKLAARVIGCRSLSEGATFMDTFRTLRDRCELPARTAFTTTVRCHRGGGLTKDAIYLRGLRDLLDYLSRGHRLDPLLVGKIALHHVPFIQELRRREIVHPVAIRPRYLDHPAARRRLEQCRHMSVVDLAKANEESAEAGTPKTAHPAPSTS